MAAPAIVASSVAEPTARTVQAFLTKPLFTLDSSFIAGTKRHPIDNHVSVNVTLWELALVGLGVLIVGAFAQDHVKAGGLYNPVTFNIPGWYDGWIRVAENWKARHPPKQPIFLPPQPPPIRL